LSETAPHHAGTGLIKAAWIASVGLVLAAVVVSIGLWLAVTASVDMVTGEVAKVLREELDRGANVSIRDRIVVTLDQPVRVTDAGDQPLRIALPDPLRIAGPEDDGDLEVEPELFGD
jgi:hypothetical protein